MLMGVNSLPFDIERLPQRRLALGYIVSFASFALVVAVTIAGIAGIDHEVVPLWIGFPVFFGALLFAGAASQRISSYGKKLRQWDALTKHVRDGLAPVIFLRSFADEDRFFKAL